MIVSQGLRGNGNVLLVVVLHLNQAACSIVREIDAGIFAGGESEWCYGKLIHHVHTSKLNHLATPSGNLIAIAQSLSLPVTQLIDAVGNLVSITVGAIVFAMGRVIPQTAANPDRSNQCRNPCDEFSASGTSTVSIRQLVIADFQKSSHNTQKCLFAAEFLHADANQLLLHLPQSGGKCLAGRVTGEGFPFYHQRNDACLSSHFDEGFHFLIYPCGFGTGGRAKHNQKFRSLQLLSQHILQYPGR